MPNSEKVLKQKVSQMTRGDQKNVRKSQDGGHFRFGYISESMPNSEKVLKTKMVPNDKTSSKKCSKNPRWRLLPVWLHLRIYAE
jgi:hypothetical protein